jgi:hypothetical protein
MKDGDLTYKVIEQYSATGCYNIILLPLNSRMIVKSIKDLE